MATAKMEKFIFFNDNWDVIQKVYHGNVRHDATILLTMDCSFILDINDIDKYLRKSTRALRRLRLIPVHCRPKIVILNTGINEMEIFRKDSNNEALRVLQSSILEWPVLNVPSVIYEYEIYKIEQQRGVKSVYDYTKHFGLINSVRDEAIVNITTHITKLLNTYTDIPTYGCIMTNDRGKTSKYDDGMTSLAKQEGLFTLTSNQIEKVF